MSSIFKQPFLSIAGQKERIVNVGKTINAAFNPLSKDKVVANTSNKTVNKALQTVANHPYATAGVIAAGVTAVKYAPSIMTGTGKAALPTIAAKTGSNMIPLIAAGGAGLVAGSLFGSGKATTGDQYTNPTQTPTQTTNTSQDTIYGDNYSYQYLTAGRDITGSPSVDFAQSPTQNVLPTQSAYQDTTPSQSATTESGTNWILIAAIAAGAYIFLKK